MSDKSYRLVVFDWEGTLADTLGSILQVIDETARELNINGFDEKKARKYASFGLHHVLKKLFPNISTQVYTHLENTVQSKLAQSAYEVALMPGARALIESLSAQGIYLGIATNKGAQSLSRALELTGLSNFFKVTRSAGQVPAKPNPLMLQEIMSAFDVLPVDTLMIGDSLDDMRMAYSAEVDAVGFTSDASSVNALRTAGAKDVFFDYEHLTNYLKSMD